MSTKHQLAPFQLEGRDFAQMQRRGRVNCRRCGIPLKVGDMIKRIGNRPVKYFHQNCFRVSEK